MSKENAKFVENPYVGLSVEDLTPILKKEAEEFLKLTKEYKQTKYIKIHQDAYLISKAWLRQWKDFTDYDTIKAQSSTFSFYTSNHLKNKKYQINPEKFPGPIKNNDILVPQSNFYNTEDSEDIENIVVRHDINLNTDLRIMNEDLWNFFYSRYKGGPIIKKPLVEEVSKGYNKRKVYEVLYMRFKVIILPERKLIATDDSYSDLFTEPKDLYISKLKTIDDLKSKILKAALKRSDLKESNLRVWRVNGEIETKKLIEVFNQSREHLKKGELLKDEGLYYCEYIKGCQLHQLEAEDIDTYLIEINPTAKELDVALPTASADSGWIFEIPEIEIKVTKCEWCSVVKLQKLYCPCKEVWYCSEVCQKRDASFHENRCKKRVIAEECSLKGFTSQSRRGKVGLQNLGNTCFMNTSLQCIASCLELAQYFFTDQYKVDINQENPLGTQGVLATSFATLIKNIYFGESLIYSPRNFKKVLGTFQSMFTGFQQHDTQEFLNFLLDGLHEDLNRVIKKPFVELDETPKEDRIKANDQWIGFLKRNQSVLVELFFGQFKTTISCPCSHISTKFDPFSSIPLPLVNKTQPYEIICYFIFYDNSIVPIQLNLQFNTKTTIMALRNKVAKILNINSMSFVVVKMNQKGSVEQYYNAKATLAKSTVYTTPNEKPYFLFQIDPEVFKNSVMTDNSKLYFTDFTNVVEYLNNNNHINKRIFEEEYEEEESDSTTESVNYYSTSNYMMKNSTEKAIIKYNTDNNYGIDPSFMITQLFMFGDNGDFKDRIRLVFPRIVYLSKTWSIEDIYKNVFLYFSNLIAKASNKADMPPDKLLEHFASDRTKFPFRLYINSFYNKDRTLINPLTQEKIGFEDDGFVVLDPEQKIMLSDLIEKLPKNSENRTVDNTFFFMNENKKYYSNIENRDVYLLVLWKPEFHLGVKGLNDKRDFDFKVSKRPKESIDLDDCFKQFNKEEQLEGGEEFYCSSCKNHTRSKTKMELYKIPPIMIIFLKRFKHNTKIDTKVEFPIKDLDMNKYLIGEDKNRPNQYDLFAVAHHYGGLGGGHYVASAKNSFDNQWYNFNDQSVSIERTEEEIINSSAYCLFYKHKDFKSILNLEEIYNKKFIDYSSIPASTPSAATVVSDHSTQPITQENSIAGETTIDIDKP